MSFYTLGIFAGSSHDGSLCLLKDDQIQLLIPSERLEGKKHSYLTHATLESALKHVKRITNHINHVVVSLIDANPDEDSICFMEDGIKESFNKYNITCDKIVWDLENHHLFHAAAVFYTSGMDDAACIVIDGVGSTLWVVDQVCCKETTTLFEANNDGIRPFYKNLFYIPLTKKFRWNEENRKFVKKHFPHDIDVSPFVDIGMMYGLVSLSIGYDAIDGGKTMGLSAYGKPNNLMPMLVDNTIKVNGNFFKNDHVFDEQSLKFERWSFKIPDFDMTQETKMNLAFNIQRACEKILVERVKEAVSVVKSTNIVFSGGCAMNILANTKIKQAFPNHNFYVDPIAQDTCQSLGAALYHYKRLFPKTKFKKLDHLFLGPEYSIIETKDKLLKLVEQYNNESSLPVNSNQQ